MPRALVALGSNLGDRQQSLADATSALARLPSTSIAGVSTALETAPMGGPAGQGSYLNSAALLVTELAPHELLAHLLRIENELGRTREQRWDARTIDLDLLLYGEEVIDTPTLVVPHPRLAMRRFVLSGAAEIAADLRHPQMQRTVGQMLDHLDHALPYVAIAGRPGSGKRSLAERLATAFKGRFIADPAPGGAVDPAGSQFDRQIQFLDSRERVLRRQDWPRQSALAVSDFYFDQALAFADESLETQDRQRFHAAWQSRIAAIVSPKLIVALGMSKPTSAQPEHAASHVERLARLLMRPGPAPVLWLSEGDPERQFEEVRVTVESMQ